jgi:DNA-binding transcriptional regulator YbjK
MTTALTPARRAIMIGDAATEVLATHGGKGLTHRAVDRLLQWPEGTTSRYHRTRDSLMNAVVQRLIDEEVAHVEHWQRDKAASRSVTRADVAQVLRRTYQDWIDSGTRQIARYEMSLEGRRRPLVHDAIIAGRRRINDSVEALLTAAGCDQPDAHGTAVVSLLDGMCHDRLLHPEIAVDPTGVEDVFLRWLLAC